MPLNQLKNGCSDIFEFNEKHFYQILKREKTLLTLNRSVKCWIRCDETKLVTYVAAAAAVVVVVAAAAVVVVAAAAVVVVAAAAVVVVAAAAAVVVAVVLSTRFKFFETSRCGQSSLCDVSRWEKT